MNRCPQTDAVLEVTFAGDDLTGAQAAHVASCSECAHAVAHARRFESELNLTGADLAPEQMPSPATIGADTPAGRGGRTVKWRRVIVGGVATLMLAAVLSGQWLGGTASLGRGEDDPGSSPPPDDETMDWAEATREVLQVRAGRANVDAWITSRVERCGDVGVVFFESTPEDGERRYFWGSGHIGVDGLSASGVSESVDAAEVARLRASLPVCRIVVDAVARRVLDAVGDSRDLWTLATGQEVGEGTTRIIGATPIADGHRAGPAGEDPIPTFLFVLDRRSTAEYWIERPTISITGGSTVVGVNQEAVVGRSGKPPTMQVFADPDQVSETAFAWIDDPRVRAVDILVPREHSVLRYSVAAPGFLIQFDARVGPVDEMQYRFIDEGGSLITSGSVAAWPPEQVP